MGFFVSRQRYYDGSSSAATGPLVVEIAVGGSKKATKEMLAARFDGEGKNLKYPIDAVNIAERIYKQWNLAYADEHKRLCILDPSFKEGRKFYEFNKRGLEEARKWAEITLENMQKCGGCNKPLGNLKNPLSINEFANKLFCSEYCLSKSYRDKYGVDLKQ